MYEEYFGLERPPFKITPDTSLFYEGGKRGDILAALVYAIHRGEGIIKVVGEVGSGKTMLCRMLQLKLPATVEIVYIANPSVSAQDILFVIAHELSLGVGRDASKHQVMRMLQDYLLQRHMENKQVVLFVEEAQGMPLDTLEEIRLLSNLETDENKLLQIILFGQPELDQNLAERSIRQLRERITHNFELEPLTRDEIHSYLNFRMRQVGYTGPELISNNVAKKVEQHSEGLLRRINIIADKILLSAFAEGTHNLSSKHVTAAVNDSSFAQEAPRRPISLWWWLMPLLAVMLAFVIYQTRAQWQAFASLDSMLQPDSALPIGSATPGGSTKKPDSAAKNDNTVTDIDSESLETDKLTNPLPAASDPPAAEARIEIEEPAQIEPPVQAVEAGVDVAQDEELAVDERQQIESLAEQVDDLVTSVERVVQQARVSAQAMSATEQPDLQSDLPVSSQQTLPEMPQDSGNSSLPDHIRWLNEKLAQSQQWLGQAERNKMSIQVMMRNKSAARELVYYLRNEWPLDLSQTYLYEVTIEGRSIYRVFYSEFDSLKQARAQIDTLPQSIKVNSPYVHSVYRMRNALL
ncbi:MAG TPA: AAA family ATPase [Gammaproteobacteria bacterium]|nr:AAA family ATPase [Gammaproteobacteria bacterium]